jgi:hypothetical protein
MRTIAVIILILALASFDAGNTFATTSHSVDLVLAAVAVAPAPMPLALSLTAAAKAISVSRGMLYKIIGNGDLSITKIGARSVILTKDLERYLAKCAAASKAKSKPNPPPIAAVPIETPPTPRAEPQHTTSAESAATA